MRQKIVMSKTWLMLKPNMDKRPMFKKAMSKRFMNKKFKRKMHPLLFEQIKMLRMVHRINVLESNIVGLVKNMMSRLM